MIKASALAILTLTLLPIGCNGKAKASTARLDACQVRRAATLRYVSDSYKCPTVASLVADKAITTARADPWGTPFKIDCVDPSAPSEAGNEVTVTSAGPDAKMGTDDDIAANKDTCAPFTVR